MGIIFLIYNLISSIILIILLPYLYFKRHKRNDGIAWIKEKFGLIPEEKLTSINARPIWIHAVSVGETMASLPLIKAIKEKYPERSLVLSTITDTGNFIARERAVGVAAVIYLPFDTSLSVKNVLKKIRPVIFIMIETEIWPNLIRILREEGIPSVIVSGRISNRSFKGYKKIRVFIKSVLKGISMFGMQTALDAERIKVIGAEPSRIEITGNLKFDQNLPEDLIDPESAGNPLGINGMRLLVAGSTHAGEEEMLLRVFGKVSTGFKDIVLLIAPRHINRVRGIEGLIKEMGITHRRRTEIPVQGIGDARIIILDTIGELARIYSLAEVVFVGGSLVPAGGHNILEPAIYSKPIIFGKYMENFEDLAQKFLEENAAVQISDEAHLEKELTSLLADRDKARLMGMNAKRVLEENRGAVTRSLSIIEKCISETL